jgi:hypothetical protein
MVKKTASRKSMAKMSKREIVDSALKLGAKKARVVAPRKVTTGNWVRWKFCYTARDHGFTINVVRDLNDAQYDFILVLIDWARYRMPSYWERRRSQFGQTREIGLPSNRRLMPNG